MKIYVGKNSTQGKETAEEKAQKIANAYVEADPNLTYDIALGKVWENHPELIAEYEAETGLTKDKGFTKRVVGKNMQQSQTIAEAKIQSIAKWYVEKDPNLTYDKALAKAWEEHPELVAEYEKQAGF